MAKHSNKKRPRKTRSNAASAKPYPEFPLTPHPSDRWRKIHKGVEHYFGKVSDGWEAALEKYEHDWPYILKGEKPPSMDPDALPEGDYLTLGSVVNIWLDSKRKLLDNGELSPLTHNHHLATGRHILKAIGRTRDINSIGPDDFATLREHLAKGRSLKTLGIWITRCKAVFNFAVEEELMTSALRYGQGFKPPTTKSIKKEEADQDDQFIEADDCLALIDAAGVHLRAMILLGLNAGFGNTDIGELQIKHLKLGSGFVAMPRPKTGERRRASLWPETVDALRGSIKARPKPSDDASGLVFVTRTGKPWVRNSIKANEKTGKPKLSTTDAVGGEFSKLLKRCEMTASGRGFYALRHTYRTVVDDLPDLHAIDYTMGHASPKSDMGRKYAGRRRIADERLVAVADHVHQWLFNKKA